MACANCCVFLLRRFRRGRRARHDLVDPHDGIALRAQIHAHQRGQLGRCRRASALSMIGVRLRLRVEPRNRHRRAEARAGRRSACQAASLASPSVLASAAARSATSCVRTLSLTSSKGSARAGAYCVDAARCQLVGADLDRLGVVLALERIGRKQRAQEVAAGQRARRRRAPACAPTLPAVRIVSFSLSAAGFRLSGCW